MSEPQSGCPGSTNPRPAAEKILDFVLRQIFLFSSRGDKLSVNPVYVASFQPRIRGNLQFRLIPAHFLPDTGKRKKLLSFHLINTRTGENVTVSHCRQTPALCREEELRNLLFAKKSPPCKLQLQISGEVAKPAGVHGNESLMQGSNSYGVESALVPK